MDEQIDYLKIVEKIMYNPDWKEKPKILKKFIKRLIELEKIEQLNNELTENESEYED